VNSHEGIRRAGGSRIRSAPSASGLVFLPVSRGRGGSSPFGSGFGEAGSWFDTQRPPTELGLDMKFMTYAM